MGVWGTDTIRKSLGIHCADRHNITIPKLKNRTRTTAWNVNNYGITHNKVHHTHVFLKGTCILRFRSCSNIECIDRKKSQEACSSTMVLQLSRRTLLEGTLGSPRPQTRCSQQDVAAWDTWRLLQTAPEPVALHRFHPAQPASLPCSALACPLHHIPVRLGLIISARAEFPFGWCCGVASALSVLVHYSRGRHTGNRTTERQRQRHLWHLLCVVSYITLWYSGVDAAWWHNWSAGNSCMFQNKEHVEKSVLCRYTFVSVKKTGQPRKLVKYCSPMS